MKKYFGVLLGFSVMFSAVAKEGDRHHHDAHEHGVAEMNIAWVKNDFSIELEGPSHNFVGFEYQPKTNEQRQKVESVNELLHKPNQLFLIDNPSCKVSKIQVDSPFQIVEHHSEDKHDKHDKHEGKHEEDSTHSEYALHYEYDCSEPKSVLNLDLKPLFNQFSNIEKLKVQWLSATQQNAVVLTPSNTKITLK